MWPVTIVKIYEEILILSSVGFGLTGMLRKELARGDAWQSTLYQLFPSEIPSSIKRPPKLKSSPVSQLSICSGDSTCASRLRNPL